MIARGYASRIGDTSKFRYFCPKGHTHIKDLNGNKMRSRYPIGEAGIRMLASSWSKEHGGVSFDCPKCKQAAPVAEPAKLNRNRKEKA